MGKDTIQKRRFSRSGSSGAAVYKDYQDNFVIWPGREGALDEFVNQTYGGRRHKLRHTKSSNSEDALTWSCFDTLNQLKGAPRARALADLWALAFEDRPIPEGFLAGKICIGKKYGDEQEQTEVDASIEEGHVLVFIEAKLYSPMSPADLAKRKPHDQIARKLRIGLKEAQRSPRKDFYFIVLDIAPKEMLRGLKPGASLSDAKQKPRGGFASKWLTAYWFSRYRGARGGSVNPLREALKGISGVDAEAVARNMGWLTWSDVFKAVLRAAIASRSVHFTEARRKPN
jgi:hypothetical protein